MKISPQIPQKHLTIVVKNGKMTKNKRVRKGLYSQSFCGSERRGYNHEKTISNFTHDGTFTRINRL